MSTAGMRMISKVSDLGDAKVFKRFSLSADYFATELERKLVNYIEAYGERNAGKAPSPEELGAEFPEFADEYFPNVPASFEALAEEVKNDWAEREQIRFFRENYARLAEKMRGTDLVKAVREHLEQIESAATTKKKIGYTLAELGQMGREEYERRKSGKSFKVWKTPFPSLDEGITGLFSGDVYGIIAESGRGKSYLTIAFIDELLRQGATVLFKSYELKWYTVFSRLISIATARDELFFDERVNQKVGIKIRGILAGKLDEQEEAAYFEIAEKLDEYYPGKLILQAKSDDHLTRSLADLDRELTANPDIDVVVIDPFNNLSDVYDGRNTNKTTGGAAEYAARWFERIIGEHDVVGLFTIQATIETSAKEKEQVREGNREIKLPTRDQVKTTKAALEIVSNLFSFDNVNGNARIGTEKGRNGGEGVTVDLIALLDCGVIREVPSGDDVSNQFVDIF
jgi:hypothetical protein